MYIKCKISIDLSAISLVVFYSLTIDLTDRYPRLPNSLVSMFASFSLTSRTQRLCSSIPLFLQELNSIISLYF